MSAQAVSLIMIKEDTYRIGALDLNACNVLPTEICCLSDMNQSSAVLAFGIVCRDVDGRNGIARLHCRDVAKYFDSSHLWAVLGHDGIAGLGVAQKCSAVLLQRKSGLACASVENPDRKTDDFARLDLWEISVWLETENEVEV